MKKGRTRRRFKEGDYVKIEKILPKNRYLVNYTYSKPIPPKRLLGKTGKIFKFISNVVFGKSKLYIVEFIHMINYDEGWVSKEQYYFYENELEMANESDIKEMKKWEDLIYAKQLAVKL